VSREEPRRDGEDALVEGALVDGAADVIAGDTVHAVSVRLSARFEPIDGRVHWGGRIAPHPGVAALLRAGRRSVQLRLPGGVPVPARLTELDPWGGVRVTGVGAPPAPVRPL
jgi:hypothetical protein